MFVIFKPSPLGLFSITFLYVYFRSVCNLFDVGRATGIRIVRRVVDALFEIAPQVIKWPALDTQQNLSIQFERKAGFPGVIGCIDGCHIPIQAPRVNPESYYNRKSFYSIVLQVCNFKYNLKFIYSN